jgi:dihydrodipicolinate synthase/N-acetylneuraminate lyase
MGSKSAHSGIASFAPNLSNELFQSAMSGDVKRAQEACKKFAILWDVMYADFPNSLKAAMTVMERPVGDLRPPHPALSKEMLDFIRVKFEDMDFMKDEPHGWYL